MSVAQDLPTEALLVSVDFFTENDHLSMELEISWDQEISENIYLM